MNSEWLHLVDAIRLDPAADNPRLVAADWLDEQGSAADTARADLIRTQIARSQAAVDDPSQGELQARELRLLKQFGPVWCGRHRHLKKCIFRRGFIEYVHLHLQHFQHHRRELMRLEPIRDVRFTGWCRSPAPLIERVARCEELKFLDTLRIHHQGPHKGPDGRINLLLASPYLTRLKSLQCTYMEQFSEEDRWQFERLPVLSQLEELDLPVIWAHHSGVWFSDPDRGGSVDRLARLRSVSIGYASASISSVLADAKAWPNLESLKCHFTGWVRDDDEVAPLLEWLPAGIKHLQLSLGEESSVEFGPADGDSAVDARQHSNEQTMLNARQAMRVCEVASRRPLETLDLRAAQAPVDGLRMLLGPESQCRLRSLTLSGVPLSDAHAEVLAQAESLQHLHTLRVSRVVRYDAARGSQKIASLMDSPHRRGITHLEIAGQSGEGLYQAIANSVQRLRRLKIGASDGNLPSLLSSPCAQGLSWVDISTSYNREAIRQQDYDAATQLPHLVALFVSNAWGTEAELKLVDIPYQFIHHNRDTLMLPPVEESREALYTFFGD